MTRFTFVGGKGGVGKTTRAASLAVASSASSRTLIVSTDPASSLSDVFGVPVGASPRRIPGRARLLAVSLDAAREFDAWLAPRRTLLSTIALRGTYLDADDVSRLLRLSLPGIDEVIALIAIQRLAAGYEHIVIDTAPTGHTLRLLASPALLERVADVFDQLQQHHRDVVVALRGGYVPDRADAFISEIQEAGRSLASLLRNKDETAIEWVTLPEPMALEETVDALNALGAAGIAVRRLIVNRVTAPPPGPCAWCEARRRFEARALRPVASTFRGMEIVSLPAFETEPVGLKALNAVRSAATRYDGVEAATGALQRRVVARLRPEAGSAQDVPGAVVPAAVRWLVVGGKGGVGKSTCASAIAMAAAARGRRVLLLSADPAHSLGDVFGVPIGNAERAIPGAPRRLRVREIDAPREFAAVRDTYVEAVDAAFDRVARGGLQAGADAGAFRRLIDLAPPGVDELIAIADVAEALEDRASSHDLVVMDTAPTGHALRLLETPAILREWTQALMTLLLKYQEIVAAGSLGSLLVSLSKRLRHIEALLQDPARTAFFVVTRPAELPRAETRRLVASLRRMRIPFGGVIVNAAGAGTCRRCRSVLAAQVREIGALRRALPGRGRYAIIETPAEVPPPHRAVALSAWGARWQRLS